MAASYIPSFCCDLGQGVLIPEAHFPQREETQIPQRGPKGSPALWGSDCWMAGCKHWGWLLTAPHPRTSSLFTLLTPKGTPRQEPRAMSLFFSGDGSWRCRGEA